VIRQGIIDFIPAAHWPTQYNYWTAAYAVDWYPIFKHGILETGLFDLDDMREKYSNELLFSFGGNRVGRQTSDGEEEINQTGGWSADLYGFRASDSVPSPYRGLGRIDPGATVPDSRIIRMAFLYEFGSDIDHRRNWAAQETEHFFEVRAPSDPCRLFALRIEAGQTVPHIDNLGAAVTVPFSGHRAHQIPYRDLESLGITLEKRGSE
jgi:hypothetical protein